MSMVAVGRRYGVSDNAVRKWIRWYERGFEETGETEAA
jgi:transposase-like protein